MRYNFFHLLESYFDDKPFFREKIFRTSISRLREELVRAQALIREANDIAKELRKDTEFTVTLRIPAHSLTPNRKVRFSCSLFLVFYYLVTYCFSFYYEKAMKPL